VVGLDDWAWRKGSIMDHHGGPGAAEVIDLLPDRSAGATADWLKRHPEIEIISRDRCGLFAQGAHEAHRTASNRRPLHILQNLRETTQAHSAARRSSASPLLQRPSTTSVRR